MCSRPDKCFAHQANKTDASSFASSPWIVLGFDIILYTVFSMSRSRSTHRGYLCSFIFFFSFISNHFCHQKAQFPSSLPTNIPHQTLPNHLSTSQPYQYWIRCVETSHKYTHAVVLPERTVWTAVRAMLAAIHSTGRF
jgi:hypothetical protein